MTNKELIDYCNANWNKVHRCTECHYHDTYCEKFRDKYGDTPFLTDPEHTWSDGRYKCRTDLWKSTSKVLMKLQSSLWQKAGESHGKKGEKK